MDYLPVTFGGNRNEVPKKIFVRRNWITEVIITAKISYNQSYMDYLPVTFGGNRNEVPKKIFVRRN